MRGEEGVGGESMQASERIMGSPSRRHNQEATTTVPETSPCASPAGFEARAPQNDEGGCKGECAGV